MGDYLQLSPPELRFRFELRKNIPVTLSLTNNGDERIAFKVKLQHRLMTCVTLSLGKREYLNCMSRLLSKVQVSCNMMRFCAYAPIPDQPLQDSNSVRS